MRHIHSRLNCVLLLVTVKSGRVVLEAIFSGDKREPSVSLHCCWGSIAPTRHVSLHRPLLPKRTSSRSPTLSCWSVHPCRFAFGRPHSLSVAVQGRLCDEVFAKNEGVVRVAANDRACVPVS